jgi:hypothetical protein
MNTIDAAVPIAPPPLLSASSRLASALGVVALVSLCWIYAEGVSHQAVLSATEVLSPGTSYVTLPSVQIVGRRGQGGVSSAGRAQAA